MATLCSLLFLLGLASIGVGAWWWHPAAGCVVAGVELVVIAVLLYQTKPKKGS